MLDYGRVILLTAKALVNGVDEIVKATQFASWSNLEVWIGGKRRRPAPHITPEASTMVAPRNHANVNSLQKRWMLPVTLVSLSSHSATSTNPHPSSYLPYSTSSYLQPSYQESFKSTRSFANTSYKPLIAFRLKPFTRKHIRISSTTTRIY